MAVRLTFATPFARLAASALISAGLLVVLVQVWSSLSQVKENLVTDWWEAPGLAAESAPDSKGALP
jgi:hypothetical protein